VDSYVGAENLTDGACDLTGIALDDEIEVADRSPQQQIANDTADQIGRHRHDLPELSKNLQRSSRQVPFQKHDLRPAGGGRRTGA
jgi:hypothetical protein